MVLFRLRPTRGSPPAMKRRRAAALMGFYGQTPPHAIGRAARLP